MQSPDRNTPVSKSLDLSAYTTRMVEKFPGNTALAGAGAKMQTSAGALDAAQNAYRDAVRDILPARVDVKFENHASDRRIRQTQQKAEIADGKRGGKIAAFVFPEGSATITKLVGASQVEAMIALEGRLAGASALWEEADTERAAIQAFRERYELALAGRKKATQRAQEMRSLRNAAKEKFLTTYAEVIAVVSAEFPRDKAMQDLFFDEVRTKSAQAAADDAADEGDAGAEIG